MRCLICAYNLSASPAGPCPECGRPFDPADPLTYRSPEHHRRQARHLTTRIALFSLPPLLFVVLLHLAYLAAATSLGRWPHPYTDDPGGFLAAAPFLSLAVLVMLAAAPCFIAGCILWLLLACLHPTRCLPALLLFLALWGGGSALLLWDPTPALSWFLD